MATPNLPQEILIDIFRRLPTKSVGRCGCLSKAWNKLLLSDPQFIKSHLTQKPHEESLILISSSHSTHIITDVKDNTVTRKLELPGDRIEAVVGSCDGLVLLVNQDHDKFLVNPITLQQAKIPNSPLALKRKESFSMYGFGHDSFSDDYKIVTLSYYDTDNEYEPDCVDTFVDVFSVKRGAWKRVQSSPYDHAVPELSSGAFVNGAIHWLAASRERGYPSVIAAFRLMDEEFDEVPYPPDVDVKKFVFYKLVVLGGCLCMIDNRSNPRTDIWIMKVYGVRESWTKLRIDVDYDWDIEKPLCCIGHEEIVLLTEEDTLVVYKHGEGMLRGMVVDGAPATYIDGGTFVQSLVSPALLDRWDAVSSYDDPRESRGRCLNLMRGICLVVTSFCSI